AARASTPPAAASSAQTGAPAARSERLSKAVRGLRPGRSRGRPVTSRPGRDDPAVSTGAKPGAAAADSSAAGGAAAAASHPRPSIATTVTTAVPQVTSGIPIVNQVVSSLPVAVPQVPPPPPAPALPALPALPSVPALPQLPAVPGLP